MIADSPRPGSGGPMRATQPKVVLGPDHELATMKRILERVEGQVELLLMSNDRWLHLDDSLNRDAAREAMHLRSRIESLAQMTKESQAGLVRLRQRARGLAGFRPEHQNGF